jgi:hypothetical protein
MIFEKCEVRIILRLKIGTDYLNHTVCGHMLLFMVSGIRLNYSKGRSMNFKNIFINLGRSNIYLIDLYALNTQRKTEFRFRTDFY